MTSQNRVARVPGTRPHLRFPGFEEKWHQTAIGDFFDLTEQPKRTSNFDKERVLTVKLYAKGVVKSERTTLTGAANYFNRKAGQFIFSKIDLLNGAFGLIPNSLDGFASSSDVPAYSFKAENSPIFFVNWLMSCYQRLDVERAGTSSTLKRVSLNSFLALPVLVPTSAEQRKIADCLSSLDGLIAAESQKLDTLKAYRNGLIQQLFPREGETLPNLRFPEFQGDENWKEVALSTLIDLISGQHLAPDEYSDTGDVPYFTGPSDYTNDLTSVGKWTSSSGNVGLAGDILITVKGSGVGELLFLELDQVAIGRQLMAVRPRSVHAGFVLHFLTTQRQRFMALASGNLIPGLSRGDILSLTVSIPEWNEQRVVADCLSSIDDLVAVQTQRIDGIRALKKGLMQHLFPTPNEEQE